MKYSILLFAALLLAVTGCKKDDPTLGGSQSPMGEVGNNFTASFSIPGLTFLGATVTELENGISTISGSAQITNPTLANLANIMAGLYPASVTIVGDMVSATAQGKFTDEGIAAVFDEGELILVRYDASVGDEYSLKIDGKTITNKVVYRSDTDDYFWNGMFIKVIKMESTGQDPGGLETLHYYANHRFGIVGIEATFDNADAFSSAVYSSNWN